MQQYNIPKRPFASQHNSMSALRYLLSVITICSISLSVVDQTLYETTHNNKIIFLNNWFCLTVFYMLPGCHILSVVLTHSTMYSHTSNSSWCIDQQGWASLWFPSWWKWDHGSRATCRSVCAAVICLQSFLAVTKTSRSISARCSTSALLLA